MAYTYQKQGRIREAQQLYLNSLKLKIEDIALTAIACNNIVVINKEQNIFDSKKKMKTAINEQSNNKLLSNQRKCIALNNILLHYYTNQFDQCKKLCSTVEQEWPDLVVYASIVESLTYIKEDNYIKALELLSKCVTVNETDKLYLQLVCVHLWLIQVS